MHAKRLFSRRQFMRSASKAAGAAWALPYIVPSSVLGQGSVAPSNRITIGCIGVGGHGIARNLRGFLAQEDAQVVAVCDVDSNNLAQARQIVN